MKWSKDTRTALMCSPPGHYLLALTPDHSFADQGCSSSAWMAIGPWLSLTLEHSNGPLVPKVTVDRAA